VHVTGDGLTFALLFAGLALTLGLGVLALAGDGGSKKAAKRLEAVRERHSGSREVLAQAQMKKLVSQRDNKLDSLVTQFIPRPAELRLRLERTGRTWSPGNYALASGGILVGTAGALLVAGAPLLFAIVFAAFLALAIPHVAVGMLIGRRAAAFTTRFPDAIDLLVRGLRSGLPVTESLGVVGREIADPVGIEFRMVADKIRIGRTMEEALQEAATRINTPEFQFFVITLSIQRETGGNLAETLGNLADVLRKRAQMKLKIKAMSSESKASAYIVGCMPFAVFALVWMSKPDYLAGFFTDTRLIIAGVGGLIWMSIGGLIMAKMVSFEI
jgi:tight adherence protein B